MTRFGRWVLRRLECRQAFALMSDYMDGRLAPREARRLERHLAECDACREYLAQLRVTAGVLGDVQPDALSNAEVDELVDLYRRWRADRV